MKRTEKVREDNSLRGSTKGSPPLRSQHSSPRSNIAHRRRSIVMADEPETANLADIKMNADARERDPWTPPPLEPDHDTRGSSDTGSSHRRARDTRGRFAGSSGSPQVVASPSQRKKVNKRANEAELLRENLMHGNFRPADVNNLEMAGPGLRSSTRAKSNSQQASESANWTRATSSPLGQKHTETTLPGYESDVEMDHQESKAPMLEDDIEMQSGESDVEEPTKILCNLEAVEHVLIDHAKELAEDHEYYTKRYLAAARGSVPTYSLNGATSVGVEGSEVDKNIGNTLRLDNDSPFAHMRAIDTINEPGSAIGPDEEVMAQVVHPATKGPKGPGAHKSTLSVRVTSFKTDGFQVPFYTHYVSASSNFRAENCDKLLYAPYFHDDQEQTPDLKGLETHLNEEYKNLVDKRPSYVQLLHKSAKWRPYVEAFLEEIGCCDGDVLRYLLQPISDATAEMELDQKTLALWKTRDSLRKDDFDTDHPKWREVLKNLPPSTDKALAFAGIASHAFSKVANFDIWHVVRRSATVETARRALQPTTKPDPLTEIQSTLCRICHRLNCPYHGINEEEDDSSGDDDGEESDESGSTKSKTSSHTKDNGSAVEGYYSSDEDGINDERLVLAPKTRRLDSLRSPTLLHSRRLFDVGRWLDKGVTNMMHMRKPFWPCDHEGSCESKKCRCWRQGINCEKACGCSGSCKRRFPGCTCALRGKPCSSESKCACRALNRECDADLCGTCGAREVLDPVNRYDDDVLIGRCHNVSIQRDRPKNTKVGISQVVGCGLYACEDIPQGSYISEYKGEICGHLEGERRGVTNGYRPNNYLFTVSGDTYDLDSMHYGNKTRFINNSQNVRNINLEAKLKLCNMVVRIGMFAARDIRAGEELLFNYGYEKQISDTFWEPGEAPKEKTLGRIGAASSKRKSKAKAQLSTRASPASTELGRNGHLPKNNYKRRVGRKLDEIPQDDEDDIDYRPSSQISGLNLSRTRATVPESESEGEDAVAGAEADRTPNGKHRRPRSAQNTPRGKLNTKEAWANALVEDSEVDSEGNWSALSPIGRYNSMDEDSSIGDDEMEI